MHTKTGLFTPNEKKKKKKVSETLDGEEQAIPLQTMHMKS